MKVVDVLVLAMLPRHAPWISMDYGENIRFYQFHPLAVLRPGFARVLVGRIARLIFLCGVQVESCETEQLDCSCLTIHRWVAKNDNVL